MGLTHLKQKKQTVAHWKCDGKYFRSSHQVDGMITHFQVKNKSYFYDLEKFLRSKDSGSLKIYIRIFNIRQSQMIIYNNIY